MMPKNNTEPQKMKSHLYYSSLLPESKKEKVKQAKMDNVESNVLTPQQRDKLDICQR